MPTLIYAAHDAATARAAIRALRDAGFTEKQLSVIARSDVELEQLPERFVEEDTDAGPALSKGIAMGGAAGLLAGLVAVAFPPAGIALGGAALLGTTTVVGAGIGAFSATLVGASVPHERREAFEAEVAAGNVVVFVDVADEAERERAVAALAVSSTALRRLEG